MQKLVFSMASLAVRDLFPSSFLVIPAKDLKINYFFFKNKPFLPESFWIDIDIIFEFFLFPIGVYAGIGNVIGGVVNSFANLLSLIPRTLSSMLDGLLGSSRRGDIGTLTKHLITLTKKLPGELRSGGQNAIFATLQTIVDIFTNLSKAIRGGNAGDMNQIFQHIQNVVQILQGRNFRVRFRIDFQIFIWIFFSPEIQESTQNVGARATLSSVIIQLQLLQQTAAAPAKEIQAAFRSMRTQLNAVLKALQSNNALGGMTSDQDALKNIFIIFQMINTNVQSGNTQQVASLLKQLQYLLNGLGE